MAAMLVLLPALLSVGMANPFPRAPLVINNPVLYQDLADLDPFRVNDTFYYSASSMHFSPGAPLLRSYNLADWEYVGNSVPSLDFGSPAYSLDDGMRAYARGVWASAIRYRQSNGLWYWIGCVDFNSTYFYTAENPTGPWEQRNVVGQCLYDCGLLIDDDDTMYVSHGSTNLSVAQLTPDGLDIAKDQVVFNYTAYIEGSRMYKRKDNYYILTVEPVVGEYVLKSDNPFGPYEFGVMLNETKSPSGLAGGDVPHQGGIVDTPDGDWYYMSFVDVCGDSCGRVPVIAPFTWGDDGFPKLELAANNTWPETVPVPVQSPSKSEDTIQTGPRAFQSAFGEGLAPEYQWNHNPDNSKWSLHEDGVCLETASVTDDLYQAKNTLTHRIIGPQSQATIELDISSMQDGDRTGLSMFRDVSAWIGVKKDGSRLTLAMHTNLTMNGTDNWATINKGVEDATHKLPQHTSCIWLQTTGDFRSPPTGSLETSFAYSVDGKSFTSFGDRFKLATDWQFFQGYRFAVFNYARKSLGGWVTLKSLSIDLV
ncbi:hypothetical protein LTR78_010078 [Recurvomyces mirabilis]|uniref:Beta-xylosidase C-terminal Concanavalin A-like domain-containing protein n=1 Tax=Recurvomyces mirabilis TaxID=574656 RepID=A0AAE0TQQ2_9PEZI|nr:hypothetical protein LTR78_010078 [Recurvomyces mirabilis]KAK5159816.1 hypothetical protein LTS14_001921 [Recurvomyces mirabilis]